jgi:hypothetical protein
MSKNKYFCPTCETKMEQIYCDCKEISLYKLYWINGMQDLNCGQCGLNLNEEDKKSIEFKRES